jgi:Kef-type K+ transport system membrane component KefB
MLQNELIFSLGWIVIGAAGCMILARFIRLPSIVACLIAGLLLGPVFGMVDQSDALGLIAEAGIVLLLFLVGLELSFDKIRQVGPVALVAGLGQVVFTAVGGLLLCWILGFDLLDSVFIAVGLTFSSTVVAVKLLTDKGELNDLYGRIAVGNSLVQTLVVLVALVFIGSLTDAGQLEIWPILTTLGFSLLKILMLFGGTFFVAKHFLPILFQYVASSPGTLFIWSLCWCFLVVGIATILGISIEIGALLAGVNLSNLRYSRDLQHRIKPLMNFFVAVFFVVLGVQIQLGELGGIWLPGLLLSLFVVVGNTFIFMVIIPRFGFSERTSFFAGVTGAQISEFSFIFVKMGLAASLVTSATVSLMAFVGVLTISVSAYLILYNRQIYSWVKKFGLLKIFMASAGQNDSESAAQISGHVIVVGMNSLGRLLVQSMHEKGEDVLAIDTDEKKLADLPCRTMLGSSEYLDVLLEAGLPHAKLLISALRIEEANELMAFRTNQFGIPCCIHAADISMVDNLLELEVDYLMLSKVDGVKLQIRRLQEMGVLPK